MIVELPVRSPQEGNRLLAGGFLGLPSYTSLGEVRVSKRVYEKRTIML